MNVILQVQDWLQSSLGLGETAAAYFVEFGEIVLAGLLAWIVNVVVKRVVLGVVHQLATRTKTDWDDILVEHRVFHRLTHLAPAIVIYSLAPTVFTTVQLITLAQRSAQIYMLVAGLLGVNAALNAANDIYQKFDVSVRIPILGYLQVLKIVLTVAVLIVGISIVIDKSPLLLLSGLGAMTAILLLIFKDSILGLVAGIQLVANDMVRPGDWIEMPKYSADGDVEEITLNTVKVRNFDKTVTTIPTYSLISDSFKNWRGMSESDGRRIKRSLRLDVNSVKFCTPEMIERFQGIQKLRPLLDAKEQELAEHNREHEVDDSSPVNGRRQTNIGIFREYVKVYLRDHPMINKQMTFLVRQLPPDSEGLPIELYVFSGDKDWINYEGIQADIFDHLFASLPFFELRPFQNPTGSDLSEALRATA